MARPEQEDAGPGSLRSGARRIAAAFAPSRRAVSAAFFLNGFALGSWTPQAPFVADRLGIGESLLGIVILGIGIGALAGLAGVGMAMARGGSRRPTLLCQAAMGPTFVLLAIAPTLTFAIGAALLLGAAMGGMDASMNANAVSTEGRLGRPIMSSCHGFWSLGGFAGAFLGGPAIALAGPAFHGTLVGTLIALGLAATAPSLTRDAPASRGHTPGDRHGGDHRSVRAEGGSRSDAAPSRSLPGVLKDRPLRRAVLLACALGVFALLAFSAEGIAIDWSAIYLTRDLGVTTAYSGLAFAAFSIAMATMRFAGDGLRRRFGAVRTVAVSVVVAAGGLTAIAVAVSLPGAVAGFMLMGLGLANLVPVAFSAAGQIRRLPPGVGITIATGFGYSGALITPSIVGITAETFGFAAVFATMAVVVLSLVLVAPAMHRADRPGESATSRPAAPSGDAEQIQNHRQDEESPQKGGRRVAPPRVETPVHEGKDDQHDQEENEDAAGGHAKGRP